MNKEYTSPFNNSNYNFVVENSIDLKDSLIQYAEKCLERYRAQITLSNALMNIDLAIQIESSIFEYTLNYCIKYDKNHIKPVYYDKLTFLLVNLDETNQKINNKTFKKKILSKQIDPRYIAFLSPAQIHPDKWIGLINKKVYAEKRENNIAYSNDYKCKKCGESKSKITQIQTRSADEPMTTFIICLVCHNAYKFC
jgi:DNA-directed RNA polymerase subunit M/transcription elongation factor TFIIS